MLSKMVWDEFGNYVLRTLFNRCNDELKALVSDTVNNKVMRLDSKHGSAFDDKWEFMRNVYWFRVKSQRHHY